MSKFPDIRVAAVLLALASPAFAAEAGKTGLGRPALPQEIAAWATDVRPDGKGLPPGKGSVKDGEKLFLERCAQCHGEFGEGAGRYPVLAGGRDTLAKDAPDKTIGSYWPYASTVFDYVRRAMPFGAAQSLTADETYALTAFLLNLNDIVPDEFVLTRDNFASIKMPNVDGFIDDDRATSEKSFWKKDPCMKDCKPGAARITGHATAIDVTPDVKTGPKVE
jgi:mono/diheme cytochrome c family protein